MGSRIVLTSHFEAFRVALRQDRLIDLRVFMHWQLGTAACVCVVQLVVPWMMAFAPTDGRLGAGAAVDGVRYEHRHQAARELGPIARHTRSLNDLSAEESAQLAALILEYITPGTNAEHAHGHWHQNPEHFFPGHRAYIEKLENFLRSRGAHRFVPIPFWDPATHDIPEAFRAVNTGDPLPARVDTVSLPSSAMLPRLCRYRSAAALAEDIESWHNRVHRDVGSIFTDQETSAAAALFFPWHAFVDNIYDAWLSCGN